jgi:hypothetical protein
MKSNPYVLLFFCAFALLSCKQSTNTTTKTVVEDNTNSDSSGNIAPPLTPPVVNNPPVTTPVVDPLLAHTWHLGNTGQQSFSNSAGTAGADINQTDFTASGSGVLVAVSDSGVEGTHEDLSGNFSLQFSKNYYLSSAPWSGEPTVSDSAHGTAVAGIIAASGNNGLGSRGIAYSSTLAGLKYIGAPYSINKVVDQANGVFDVFNYSYGGYSCHFESAPQLLINQLKYGTETLRSGKGAIYVKAAGNEYVARISDCFPSISDQDNKYYFGNANLEEDHSYPYYIVVGALNAKGQSSSYSTPGSSLWISAPGGEFGTTSPAIVTTDLSTCDKGYSKSTSTKNDFEDGHALNQNCNYTSTMNGTSAATPMISAAAAVLLSVNPSLSWRDVKHILATTAKKTDPDGGPYGHPAGYNLSGHTYQQGWVQNAAGYNFHNWYGFGALDLERAMQMARGYTSSLGTFVESTVESIDINFPIPDQSASGTNHQLNFTGSLTVESVQITVNINHSYIGDLGIELTSPSGTVSKLLNINSGLTQTNISGEVLLSNAFYGEPANGNWRIKVIDGLSDDVGTLVNWKLKIYGH